MSNFYPYMQSAHDLNNTMFLRLPLEGLPVSWKIVCTSTSRDCVEYELYDEFGDMVSRREFMFQSGRFNNMLVDDLNVLLDEYNAQLSAPMLVEMTKKAYNKCESRYGYSLEGGDCIITISGEPK